MTLADVVVRAQSCVGQGCVYRLGAGGMVPYAAFPWDEMKRCDCSGFSMWCVFLSRLQGDHWINTTAMVNDGLTPGGLFERVQWAKGKPGHLLVYGRKPPQKYGHVGVIASVDEFGPKTAVHASAGNEKRTGDAIRETGVLLWMARRDAIVVRCLSVDEGLADREVSIA